MLLPGLTSEWAEFLFQKHILAQHPLPTAADAFQTWHISVALENLINFPSFSLSLLPPHPHLSILFYILSLPLHFLILSPTRNYELQWERLIGFYFLPVKWEEASSALWENHFSWHHEVNELGPDGLGNFREQLRVCPLLQIALVA